MRPLSRIVTENTSLEKVAEIMRDENIGFLPVVTDEDSRRILGVVTDRDLVVHAVAENREPRSTTIGYLVSREPITASPDDDLEDVERRMIEAKVHRLPVVDEHGAVLGSISIFDLAQREDERKTGHVLRETSEAWTRL